jgi:photosystem II stability/assembly factor-like uncharacterized protein
VLAVGLSGCLANVSDLPPAQAGDAGVLLPDAGMADAGFDAGTDGGTDAPMDAGTTPADAGEWKPSNCSDTAPIGAVPASAWVNATGNLAGMAAGCANLSRAAAVPCSQTVIVGIADRGLWASDDSGKLWRQLGTGAGSAEITNATSAIVFDPKQPEVFWETGIRGTAGVYKTSDFGKTFKQLGTTTFTQFIAVDFSDPERKVLLTGTHGMKQQVYYSGDQGVRWTNVGLNLPSSATNSEFPIVLDSKTYLLGACDTGGQGCGIYRTTDAGAHWTQTSDLGVSHFGAPLWASDGSIYWPLVNDGGLARSTDLGLTWTRVIGPGILTAVTPIELPDGKIVAVGTDHLMRSSDGGKSWSPIGAPLPFQLIGNEQGGITYSAKTRTFFLWHWTCSGGPLPADAVMSAGFDYLAK